MRHMHARLSVCFILFLRTLTCLHASFLLATLVACMLGELGSPRCRIYWLWSLLFVRCCLCLVLFGNYIGCISSILSPPYNCLLFPFSSWQKSKFALIIATSRQTHCACCMMRIFPHYCIFYSEKIITCAQRISSASWKAHTQSLFFIWSLRPNSYIPNIYLCLPLSRNRWGPHSQTYHLRSSCVLSVHSLYPLVLLISSSHHITICPPYQLNICFYFYPCLSLTPI